jgi:hypothetical protein
MNPPHLVKPLSPAMSNDSNTTLWMELDEAAHKSIIAHCILFQFFRSQLFINVDCVERAAESIVRPPNGKEVEAVHLHALPVTHHYHLLATLHGLKKRRTFIGGRIFFSKCIVTFFFRTDHFEV